jgi:hypothetical protein
MESVVVDDIMHKTGMHIFIKREAEQLVCGEIKLILVHDCKTSFLVTSVNLQGICMMSVCTKFVQSMLKQTFGFVFL